jgi:hypothetical protein
MKLSSRLIKYSLQAMMALPLMVGMHAQALAAPAAVSTLDVCHNELTGNWRYSGMVAISGKALKSTSVVGVDYWVQNSTSSAGFIDTLRVPAINDTATLATTSAARLTRFDIEAPPLSLGVLRNSSRIAIRDLLAPAAAPLLLQSNAELTQSVCGCPHPAGCTRTQGYWKSKPGVIWPGSFSRGAPFFSSGLSWQQVLETPPQGGNAYLILAHQYIAAILNRAGGASAPSSLQSIINKSSTWFAGGTTLLSCSGSDCETQKNWSGLLDTYNNGNYPGAPQHCPE